MLILGGTLAIEWYTGTRYPTEELIITGVPELELGVTHTFSYEREIENAGTTSYIITEYGDGLYKMVSETDVNNGEQHIQLVSIYEFNADYSPIDYDLKIDQEGDITLINVTFTDSNIIATIAFDDQNVTLIKENTKEMLVTENNMPGLWEVLLLSAEFEQGKRYTANVYIPQGGDVFELEFYINADTSNIYIDGEPYACTVIQETSLDLKFYIYEGELVQMRNDDMGLIFTRIN